ncbi:hypothetical protein OG257_07940 [Streptomyces sp. NBC_00683]|uniref:hypothetical protein n=1 Tax=Streptomyces sp. NBC_00683 TaxID=2903670 RepID=UPI002E3304C2|nr:hypothetical protein [Streptomyces sp. NBC_00683]
MRALLTTAAGVCALVALTACTHGAATSPGQRPTTSAPTSAPVDTAALESSVRAYVKAYYEPDTAAAYRLLSATCRDQWTEESFAELPERATATARQLGTTYTLRRLTVGRVTKDTAQVTYGVGEPRFDETSTWVLEDGGWHNDLC